MAVRVVAEQEPADQAEPAAVALMAAKMVRTNRQQQREPLEVVLEPTQAVAEVVQTKFLHKAVTAVRESL
jgi:hypothetical protein